MNRLAIYEEPSPEEILQRAVEDAEADMISHRADGEEDMRNAEWIKEFYYANMMARKAIPCLEDIMEDVYAHNSECVWRIGSVQYEVEGWHGPEKYDETEDERCDSREETINMLCESWEEYYSDYMYCNLEIYVENTLEELELSYRYEDVHDQFSAIEIDNLKEIDIILNDCQNILFPEFMLGSDSDYERPGVDRQLFIISK